MNETRDKRLEVDAAVLLMRSVMVAVAELLNETVANFDRAMEATSPDGWQRPKDWQTDGGATVVEDEKGHWVSPAREPWQICDHEFEEWEALE